MSIGNCRACGASIRWHVMKSGKRNPMNPDPDDVRGNVLVVQSDDQAAQYGTEVGRAVVLPPLVAASERSKGTELLLSHFATCPKRGEFGRRKGRSR